MIPDLYHRFILDQMLVILFNIFGNTLRIPNQQKIYNLLKMSSLSYVPPPIKYQITLPKINFKKPKNKKTLRVEARQQLQMSHQQCLEELSKLDEWASSLPTVKRKRNQTSQSIVFLYKSHNKYSSNGHGGSKLSKTKQGLVSSVGLYLAQLDNQLNKIRKINYDSIYQNIQYCAGVYQIAFNDIFKKFDNFKQYLQESLQIKIRNMEEFREKKINELRSKRQTIGTDRKAQYQLNHKKNHSRDLSQLSEKSSNQVSFRDQSKNEQKNPSLHRQNQNGQLSNSINNQKTRILMQYKEEIEEKQKQIKPIKTMLSKLQKAKLKVLMFSLQLGFDVRDEGIIWILKQINCKNQRNSHSNSDQQSNKQNLCQKQRQNFIPKLSQFPNFLTQQQIQFIICKFKNEFKLKAIEEQKLEKQQEQKVILQNAFENVRRDRNRKLSMIKQKQLLEKLLQQRQQQVAVGHKYINSQTVRLMQSSQRIKYTKNELIYQQTLRKLNRFCIQQIYSKKQKNSQVNSSLNYSNQSLTPISNINLGRPSKVNQNNEHVYKLMSEVKKMLLETHKLKDKSEQIKTQEEKEFSDILVKLRNQRYQGRMCSERRNPISVLACLVGWRKAKRILQSQMNISMPASKQSNNRL